MIRYLVLNDAGNEGAFFESLEDAENAAGKTKPRGWHSVLADHFVDAYGHEGKHKIIEIDISKGTDVYKPRKK